VSAETVDRRGGGLTGECQKRRGNDEPMVVVQQLQGNMTALDVQPLGRGDDQLCEGLFEFRGAGLVRDQPVQFSARLIPEIHHQHVVEVGPAGHAPDLIGDANGTCARVVAEDQVLGLVVATEEATAARARDADLLLLQTLVRGDRDDDTSGR